MAGGVIALVVAPVHHREVGRGETSPFERRDLGQTADERAYFVRLREQVVAVRGRDEIVEDRPGDDREAARRQRCTHAVEIERDVTVRSEFEAGIARGGDLVEHPLPWREVRVSDIVDTPATGCGGD